MGVSRQTINSIEKERYTPSLPLAIALARYFDTTVEELFHVDDSNDRSRCTAPAGSCPPSACSLGRADVRRVLDRRRPERRRSGASASWPARRGVLLRRRRSETLSGLGGPGRDERWAMIDLRATRSPGIVLIADRDRRLAVRDRAAARTASRTRSSARSAASPTSSRSRGCAAAARWLIPVAGSRARNSGWVGKRGNRPRRRTCSCSA